MLKKILGDLTLLVFTFTCVVPSFVGVNTTEATPTRIHRQPYERDYYCGSYMVHSESGIRETTYDFDHPPDTEVSVPVYRANREGLPSGYFTMEILRYERGTEHTSHSVTTTCNSTTIHESVSLDRYHWRCR